jgi:superfamily II RNA helicase
MKIATLLLIAMWVVPIAAQDAPTIQQCRADVEMWKPKSSDYQSFYDALSTSELMHRAKLLTVCGIVAANERTGQLVTLDEAIQIGAWSDLQGMYALQWANRAMSYIKRHGELEQFWKEDTGGQR